MVNKKLIIDSRKRYDVDLQRILFLKPITPQISVFQMLSILQHIFVYSTAKHAKLSA